MALPISSTTTEKTIKDQLHDYLSFSRFFQTVRVSNFCNSLSLTTLDPLHYYDTINISGMVSEGPTLVRGQSQAT